VNGASRRSRTSAGSGHNEEEEIMPDTKIVVEKNGNTFAVGWKDEDGFTPCFTGYASREDAEAIIPQFDEMLTREHEAYRRQAEEERRYEAEQWPNIAYVRERIRKLTGKGDLIAAFDASDKLDELLNLDMHEHISWPLPGWKAIKSGRVYSRR
jgi:hypothetical protein